MTVTQAHARRLVEPDGTVHAARYAGDRAHYTTACAVYPAPECASLEATPHRAVTCTGCREAMPDCPAPPVSPSPSAHSAR